MIYFTAHTFKCVCHCIKTMFRVLGVYNFGYWLESTKVLSSYGPLSYLSDIFISAWQKCCHFSTETQNKIFKNGAKLHLYLIALMDYGCPVRNLLWCTVENPLSGPNFQVRPKHILSATSAQFFRYLWFINSLGVCSPWKINKQTNLYTYLEEAFIHI